MFIKGSNKQDCILRCSQATGAVSAAGVFQGNSCVNGKGSASAKTLHWLINPLENRGVQADFEQICLCPKTNDKVAVQAAAWPVYSAFMDVSDRNMQQDFRLRERKQRR